MNIRKIERMIYSKITFVKLCKADLENLYYDQITCIHIFINLNDTQSGLYYI